MPDWKKDRELRKNAVRFIEAAYEIIDSEGLNSLSVRKVAGLAGFHNSTIYTYFKDIDELEQLACIRYLAPYAKRVADIGAAPSSPRETFYGIWEAFCAEALANAQVYRQIFFGKYSNNLSEAIALYYDLFPEEAHDWSGAVEKMYFSHTYEARCMSILAPLANDASTRVTKDLLDDINRLIVCYTKGILDKKCASPALDGAELTRECMSMLHFIIDA